MFILCCVLPSSWGSLTGMKPMPGDLYHFSFFFFTWCQSQSACSDFKCSLNRSLDLPRSRHPFRCSVELFRHSFFSRSIRTIRQILSIPIYLILFWWYFQLFHKNSFPIPYSILQHLTSFKYPYFVDYFLLISLASIVHVSLS